MGDARESSSKGLGRDTDDRLTAMQQSMKGLGLKDKQTQMTLKNHTTGEVQSMEHRNGTDIIKTVSGSGPNQEIYHYSTAGVVGNGSFGVVFQAKCLETNETVAIKKVLQDKRFKNRELQIIRMMEHPNVVLLKHCFFSVTENDERYLHLVLEFIPSTVYKVCKEYARQQIRMPMILVKAYVFQICRAIGYIHSLGVCHRDIKPQNLLIDAETHTLKLCDFGSAKILNPGESNIAYICSRYYRAPELIFGATEYTSAIDIWSVGCVMAELMIGRPLFAGESGVDQLVEIIKVLGTPTKEDILKMNPNYNEFRFPQIKPHPWTKVFSPNVEPAAVDLVSSLLRYSPSKRATAVEALGHPFFDEILQPGCKLPTGKPLPPVTNWLPGELKKASSETLAKLGVSAEDVAVTGSVPTNPSVD